MRKEFMVILTTAALFLSCENQNPPVLTAQNEATGTQQYVPESRTDRSITRNVRVVLNKDPQLVKSLLNVRIRTSNGIVTLRGYVNTNEEREALVKKVASLRGVRSVNNQIEVKEDQKATTKDNI